MCDSDDTVRTLSAGTTQRPRRSKGTTMAHVFGLLTRTLALLALLATPPSRALPAARTVAVPAREIVLDARAARGTIPIRTARNQLTVVEFPGNIVLMRCRACATDDKQPEADALFQVEKLGDAVLAITPAPSEGKRVRSAVATTLFVQLEQTTLMLSLHRVESESAADPRVILTYPKASRSNQAAAQHATPEKPTQDAITKASRDHFLDAFLEPHQCSHKSARARHDDIVLRVTEVCQFGQRLLISFSLENRGRAPFEVASVAIGAGTSHDGRLEHRIIAFEEMARGVEYLDLSADRNTDGPHRLTVSEKGGRQRVVTVDGITP